jgi:hypothetical protein
MIREFLGQRREARDLDKNEFKRRFPQGVRKADFLLFGDSVVTEVKEIRSVQIESKVEKLWKKGALPEKIFIREILASISSTLRDADAQLADTKSFLKIEQALGLVILENLMPTVMTGPILFAAADKEMLAGLHNVDCTLCLDMINKFTTPNGQAVRFARLLRRPCERSERLSKLLLPLVQEFCRDAGAPWIEMEPLTNIRLDWIVDSTGKYHKHTATFTVGEEQATSNDAA